MLDVEYGGVRPPYCKSMVGRLVCLAALSILGPPPVPYSVPHDRRIGGLASQATLWCQHFALGHDYLSVFLRCRSLSQSPKFSDMVTADLAMMKKNGDQGTFESDCKTFL